METQLSPEVAVSQPSPDDVVVTVSEQEEQDLRSRFTTFISSNPTAKRRSAFLAVRFPYTGKGGYAKRRVVLDMLVAEGQVPEVFGSPELRKQLKQNGQNSR